jgi:hypothetical protein
VLLRKEKNLNNQNVWYWNLYVDLQSQSWAWAHNINSRTCMCRKVGIFWKVFNLMSSVTV